MAVHETSPRLLPGGPYLLSRLAIGGSLDSFLSLFFPFFLLFFFLSRDRYKYAPTQRWFDGASLQMI